METEISHGPRLSLALRARRWLLVVGAALGFAAAGATIVAGSQRGATQAYLAAKPTDCFFYPFENCSDSWWEWPPDKSPFDSPPTAIVPAGRRTF